MRHVLIADDHAVTRRGIRALVSERYPQARIEEVADGDGLLERLPGLAWDLIIVDVMMPGPGVVELLGRIRRTNPTVPLLILTATSEEEYVIATMKAGANGLLHKHDAADELIHAIDVVAAGGSYLNASSAIAVARALQHKAPSLPHLQLSEREVEIFRHIALGRAIKEIAFDLGLSEKTVATYLARIREKTGLHSHVEIARYALKNGLVDWRAGRCSQSPDGPRADHPRAGARQAGILGACTHAVIRAPLRAPAFWLPTTRRMSRRQWPNCCTSRGPR